jgi:hypothetical protein
LIPSVWPREAAEAAEAAETTEAAEAALSGDHLICSVMVAPRAGNANHGAGAQPDVCPKPASRF